MGSRLRRVLAIGAAVVAVPGLLLVGLIHTPPARSRVLSWAIGQLESRFDLLLTGDRLSYNLLTGSVTLTNVRLAARRTPDRPFFTASRVDADVPLAAYAGRLILDDVAVQGGRVTIAVSEDGVSNLPGGGSDTPPPADPRSLAIRGLRLDDFAFLYDNREMPMRISATGVAAALERQDVRMGEGIAGTFAIRGGVDVEWRQQSVRVEPVETRLAFDGRTVSMQDLPVVTAMGSMNVSGRLNRVMDALSLELGFDGQIDVARAAAWAPPPVPVAGTTRVRGTIAGPTDTVEIVVRFDAPALRVGTEEALTASGELLIDGARLLANRLTAHPESGGEIHAALDVPFGDEPLSLTATWQGVDARALMRAANVGVQPIGTRLDGEARFTTGPRRSLTLKSDLTALQAAGVIPLAGALAASVDGADWILTHELRADGVAVNGRGNGRLDAAGVRRSTISGPSTVVIASLAAADRVLAPMGVRIPEALRGSAGAIEAEAALTGTFEDPAVTLVARAPAFDLPAVGVSSLTAAVDANPNAVHISKLAISRESAEVSGDVSIDLGARTIAGSLRATVPDAHVLQGAVPERWRVGGTLDAAAALGGTFDAPTLDVQVTSPSLVLAGDTFEALDGRFRVTGDGIDVPSLDVAQDRGGRLHATGRYGFDRTYTADLDVTDMTWSGRLVGDAESRVTVNGRFAGTGSVDRPMGTGRFGVAIAGGLAGDLVGEGTLDLGLFGEIARLSASVPALGAFANATLATASPYDYRGAAVINDLDLARIAPLLAVAPGHLTGMLNATAAVNGAAGGDEPPQVHANIQQMEALVAGVPLRLLSPAAVSWQSGDVILRQSTASLGDGGTLTAGGTWSERAGATFSGSFRGEVSDVVTAARAFGLETDVVARGWMEGTLYGTNRREDLIASFDITGGSVETADGVSVRNLATSAGLSGETLTLHAISGRLDAAKAGGTFSGKGRATIPDLDPMRASGRFALDSATFDSAGIEVTQTRPTTIAIDKGLITMDDVVWEALGSQLAVGGSVDVSSGSPALNVTVQGLAVLRVLSAFVPGVGIDGTAEVDLHVGGTPGAPDLSGSVTLVSTELALATPRLVISDLSGPITLGANRIELRGLTGSANGGSLTIDGGFVLAGTDIADGEIHVQAVGMAVEYPRGLRSEVDALLTYDIGEATPILRGDVRVQRSSYTDPISLAALARANSAATVRPATGESALEELRLDIAVTTVDDMRVDNNYGRFESGAQLRIVGTAARPGMSGQVTLREGGRIYVAGRTFTLTGGTIAFTDLTRIQPDMNIQAQTRVSGIGNVTLSLQGTPDRFEFDLTSDDNPQVSRDEIATALLGGGVTGANALTLLSTDLLGASGRQIGLDAVRIERGDTVTDEFREDPSAVLQDEDPVTRLTLSKRLSDQVEFTLSQNLAESGKTTILVSYYPLSNLELRAISRDDGTQGLGIRHQITFGGDAARRAPVARPVLSVDQVRIEGTLAPFSADELRKDLKVAPREAFDYYEWQQDLDRLTARYVSSGHYEARVRGRRDPTGEGAITVVYTVSPGPATRIVVDGIEVPDADLEEIRQAWARGVFDRFIVQDAEARVQGLLVSRGYVTGIVTGTMESSSEYKTLRLTVVPGTVSRGREMRFSGNVAISRNELQTAVIQWNMADYGWIDREALSGTIRAYYRQQGYLNAQVSVSAPIEEAGRAVLPVTIEEGSRATIREVQWSGVSDEHRLAAERAAGLDVGAPYALALVEAARDRVDRRYRRLGHNSVQVTASATPAPDAGQVDVSIVVTEGTQQVLQSVETVGATRTREGVVRRALRLPIGQPANLEEWALARKRLFDTNVFRSVDIQAIPLGDPVSGIQFVQARVAVEEYPPWRFRYGLQADREPGDGGANDPTDINLGGIAEIRNQNLFGRAITGGGAALVEKDFQRAQLFLQSAAFFGLPLRSGLFVSTSAENIRYDTVILYKEDRQTLTFEQRWRRRRGFEITYGYRYERLHDYDPDPNPADPFPFDLVTNVGKLRSAFLWDRRTEPVSPTAGTFTSVSVERAATWLGADSGYGRLLVQQFAFRRLGPVVLAGRVMAGDFSGDPSVDLFQAGGATSVRGYGENTLGPVDFDGSFSGGTSLLILNQEVRFPMYRWLQGVGFVDVGNTFGPRYPFAWDELKVGYGLGLRFSSPIGLLRLDYGIPGSTLVSSTRRANEVGNGRFYFGLGHIF